MPTTNTTYTTTTHHATPFGGSPISGPALKSGAETKTPAADSPILRLFGDIKRLRRMEEHVEEEAQRLRNGLVRRHGEVMDDWNRAAAWHTDPDWASLGELIDKADDVHIELWDEADQLLEMPAETLPELLAKLQIVSWQLPPLSEDMEYGEQRTIRALQEYGAFVEGRL